MAKKSKAVKGEFPRRRNEAVTTKVSYFKIDQKGGPFLDDPASDWDTLLADGYTPCQRVIGEGADARTFVSRDPFDLSFEAPEPRDYVDPVNYFRSYRDKLVPEIVKYLDSEIDRLAKMSPVDALNDLLSRQVKVSKASGASKAANDQLVVQIANMSATMLRVMGLSQQMSMAYMSGDLERVKAIQAEIDTIQKEMSGSK